MCSEGLRNWKYGGEDRKEFSLRGGTGKKKLFYGRKLKKSQPSSSRKEEKCEEGRNLEVQHRNEYLGKGNGLLREGEKKIHKGSSKKRKGGGKSRR